MELAIQSNVEEFCLNILFLYLFDGFWNCACFAFFKTFNSNFNKCISSYVKDILRYMDCSGRGLFKIISDLWRLNFKGYALESFVAWHAFLFSWSLFMELSSLVSVLDLLDFLSDYHFTTWRNEDPMPRILEVWLRSICAISFRILYGQFSRKKQTSRILKIPMKFSVIILFKKIKIEIDMIHVT